LPSWRIGFVDLTGEETEMAAISLFNVLDWTSGLGRKFRRKSGEPSGVKEEIIVKSHEEYENLVGRFDVTDRVRSRELDVPEADRDFAKECGAVWDENAQVFKVPMDAARTSSRSGGRRFRRICATPNRGSSRRSVGGVPRASCRATTWGRAATAWPLP
jgi:hypothetical protein